MVLLINPRAAGGTALNKWKRIESGFACRFPHPSFYILDGASATSEAIRHARSRGETHFVAAGGDGTVNAVLNALLSEESNPDAACCSLGAVGLGSSNDFHKPFCREKFLADIPVRLHFHRALPCDVGALSFEHNGSTLTRYFLANASCGVTAEANWYFNNPDPLLAFLKRRSTSSAIISAAVRTILRYRNFEASLSVSGAASLPTRLTNLAVLKNPHVSGSFTYDTPVAPDDGLFALNLCEDMTKTELLNLLSSLSRGKFSALPRTRSWRSATLAINAEHPFAVEYDGEVISTRSAHFQVLPKFLRVCP
jgi:diacylglycerol kinase family enzyme